MRAIIKTPLKVSDTKTLKANSIADIPDDQAAELLAVGAIEEVTEIADQPVVDLTTDENNKAKGKAKQA